MYADGMFDDLAKFSYALFKCACVVYIHNHFICSFMVILM